MELGRLLVLCSLLPAACLGVEYVDSNLSRRRAGGAGGTSKKKAKGRRSESSLPARSMESLDVASLATSAGLGSADDDRLAMRPGAGGSWMSDGAGDWRANEVRIGNELDDAFQHLEEPEEVLRHVNDNDGWKTFSKNSDVSGRRNQVLRAQQLYRGFPVWGGEVIDVKIAGGEYRVKDKLTRSSKFTTVGARTARYGSYVDKLASSFPDVRAADAEKLHKEHMPTAMDIITYDHIAHYQQADIYGEAVLYKVPHSDKGDLVMHVWLNNITPDGLSIKEMREPHMLVDSAGYVVKEWDNVPSFMPRPTGTLNKKKKEHKGKGKKQSKKKAYAQQNGGLTWQEDAEFMRPDDVIELELQSDNRYVKMGQGPGGNNRTYLYEYGKEFKPFVVEKLGGNKCRLSSTSVFVVDAENYFGGFETKSPEEAITFDCYYHKADYRFGFGGFGAANDAMKFGMVAVRTFKSWYKDVDKVLDLPLRIAVHYGQGTKSMNAMYDDGTIVFGDGGHRRSSNTTWYGTVSLDLMGHELGHAIVSATSQLAYHGESGCVAEAFADAAAMAVVRAEHPNADIRPGGDFAWSIGSYIVPEGHGVIRCMDEPKCDGKSVDSYKEYPHGMKDPADNHYCSGIFNKLFYLVSQELDKDIWDAFDVFYAANMYHWQKTTTIIQAAEGLLGAVVALNAKEYLDYDYDIDVRIFLDNLHKVGIECGESLSSDTAYSCWRG